MPWWDQAGVLCLATAGSSRFTAEAASLTADTGRFAWTLTTIELTFFAKAFPPTFSAFVKRFGFRVAGFEAFDDTTGDGSIGETFNACQFVPVLGADERNCDA